MGFHFRHVFEGGAAFSNKGINVFVCLPTGYGKSLCYQILPLVMEQGIGGDRAVIIVSALVTILSSSTSMSEDSIGTEECLCRDNMFFCAPEAITMVRCPGKKTVLFPDCGHISG